MGATLASLLANINWKGLRWKDIDDWTTKNIIKPITKMEFARWVKGWSKKRSSPSVEYENYEGLTSDPLSGPSTNIPPSYFGGGGTDSGGLGVTQAYSPVNLKGSNHGQIFEGLINNIIQFQINKSENISSGQISNSRPNITNFVIPNMNIGELGGWKMIERNLNIQNTDVYVQARFPNARTNPKLSEPEIIALDTRTRKRGTVTKSYYVYEIYLFTDPITKSGNERTYIGRPEALILSFSNLALYNSTIKEINRRVSNGNN